MRDGAHPLAPVIAQIGRAATGVTTRWIGNQPAERQRVYYANHTSHLDFVVLWASLPGHVRRWVRPVAAADYWRKSPLRRFLACDVFQAVLVERRPAEPDEARVAAARHTIATMVESLGRQHSLIVFPEGTRGSGESIAPFKSGIYHLCRERPDLELVPAYLENLNRVLPRAEFLPVPVLCSVTFGPPLRLEAEETKAAFLERARQLLCRLQPQ
jgi:1-acyl-sn-glycerol-3-phosphate acyltransferase